MLLNIFVYKITETYYPFTIYITAQSSSELVAELRLAPASLLIIIIPVCAGSFIVAALVVVTTCWKLKREMKQNQQALKTTRDIIETYWSKKVTIEKPHNTSYEVAAALVSLF